MLNTELRLGWVALFGVPAGRDYDTGWHRDFGHEERDGSEAVEMEILSRLRKNLVKWHMALVYDACLWLIPGSHRRFRTEREREALINDRLADLPGAHQIVLHKGQTVFWNGNTIHRGSLPAGSTERLTLMGALVKHQEDDPMEELEGRFRWRMADNIRDRLPPATQLFYDRWRGLQQV
jgi:ectoine hydroxylase-related dioxygenase (phytanoyl-CoA dioxygenase family)